MRNTGAYPACVGAASIAFLLLPGCHRRQPVPAETRPRIETVSSGDIRLTIRADPPAVDFSRDMLLTITATAPTNLTVHIPSLQDRLTGFVLSGEFDREPALRNGQRTVEHCARLTPVPHREHRIAPIPVIYEDAGRAPPSPGWFPTRPMVFEEASSVSGVRADIHDIRGIVRIWPPFRTFAAYLGICAMAIAALYLVWRSARRIHRRIQLHRMSPRERALLELAELLAENLVEKNRVKEFYYALTMIVRRYIEREHRIRAPEQTTEEFLDAASQDARFPPSVLGSLKAFLEAADLVKYAAVRPARDIVELAVQTAREYIETDSAGVAGTAKETERVQV